MRTVKFNDVPMSIWFEYDGIIFAKASNWKRGSYGKTAVIYNNTEFPNDGQFSSKAEVNLDWWEAIAGDEDAPEWLIRKAQNDGANIESYTEWRGKWLRIVYPDWNWTNGKYRVKKEKQQPHTINIDGREIELSEESYNNLKESLK